MYLSIDRVALTMLAAMWSTANLAAPASEEDELALVYGDKSTVSIATGSQQQLQRAPAVATVITAEEIAATGATGLDDVLETVPGMHVSHAAIRYMPMYLVRGIGSGNQTTPQILMLQNGIPMTTMYNGDRGSAWIGVPVENIARIEVIRGPGSALYGADAYSGVINIITKTAADTPGNRFGVRAGSFNTRDAWVQHGGKWGDIDVAGYLRTGRTDGIREIITADAQTRNDTLKNTAVSLAPGPVNTGYDAIDGNLDLARDKWRVRASYKLRDNLQTGAGISSALDPNSKGRAESITSDLSWNDPQFTENMGMGLTASLLNYSFTYPTNLMLLPPGAKVGATSYPNGQIGGPNQWERQLRLSGNTTYTGLTSHSMRAGVGHDYLDLYGTKTVKNYSGTPTVVGAVTDYTGTTQAHILPHLRQVNYVYAQDEWSFAPDWALTAGLRHDKYSDFGGTTNPRLALVWDATLDLTAKLLYGTAFRAPAFNEQYGINPVANGNPNLRPETIKTIEAALSWKANRDTQINLNLFRSDMNDIISLVGTSYANTGTQRSNGMELEAIWNFSRTIRLTGNYAHQKTINTGSSQDIGYAPRHHIYARADQRLNGSMQLGYQINWVADRKRASGDTRPQVADYKTVDLSLRGTPGKDQWDLTASVRNLFNARVFEPSIGGVTGSQIPNDLPMAPRSFYLQAIYKL